MPSGGIPLFKQKKSPKSPQTQISDSNLPVLEVPRLNTEMAELPTVQSGGSLSSLISDISTLHVRETPGSGLGLFDSATASPIERARSPFFGFVRSREHLSESLDDER